MALTRAPSDLKGPITLRSHRTPASQALGKTGGTLKEPLPPCPTPPWAAAPGFRQEASSPTEQQVRRNLNRKDMVPILIAFIVQGRSEPPADVQLQWRQQARL